MVVQPTIKGVLILHSDQRSQFTSREFVEYCEKMKVTQSTSKAGYPYDNAPVDIRHRLRPDMQHRNFVI